MHYVISININVTVEDQAALLRAFVNHIAEDVEDGLEFALDTEGVLVEVREALLCLVDPGRVVDHIPGIVGTGSEHSVDIDQQGVSVSGWHS